LKVEGGGFIIYICIRMLIKYLSVNK